MLSHSPHIGNNVTNRIFVSGFSRNFQAPAKSLAPVLPLANLKLVDRSLDLCLRAIALAFGDGPHRLKFLPQHQRVKERAPDFSRLNRHLATLAAAIKGSLVLDGNIPLHGGADESSGFLPLRPGHV